MKVSARGWGRDMGEKVLGNHFLLTMKLKTDGTTYRDEPVLYKNPGTVEVAWFQTMKLTGDYRMEVEFTRNDIMKLFKCMFGSELQQNLIEEWGLTFSPEVTKAILRTVKLSDLTLGDLAAMNTAPQSEEPAATEKAAEPTKVTPFLRRRV
jgi:hypothetical protein